MNQLEAPVKHFIVSRLACFYTPTEVAAQVREEHGIEVSRQQVAAYDPGTSAGQRLSDELKELFHSTREAFRQNLADIPIANQAHRLRKLNDLVEAAKSPTLVAQLLEQAAKEVGGGYTNRREVTGAGGGKIEVGLSFEDALRAMKELAEVPEPDADAQDCSGSTGI